MPTVAILDDYHDLSSSYIQNLPPSLQVTVYRDTILPSQDLEGLLDRLKGYDVLVTMRERTPITREVIDGLVPGLKVILTTGMRNRGIEIEYAKSKGIVVAGTPSPPSPTGTPPHFSATVQHTWSMILALLANIPRDNTLLCTGTWLSQQPLNTFLPSKTLGLIGLGNLGLGVARIGKVAFGMKILAWSPNLSQERVNESLQEVGLARGDITFVTKEQLLSQSDIISLHLVLAPSTVGILSQPDLDLIKPTSFLVNTSRGPLIEEKALLDILEKGKIRGYAADVFDIEPLPVNSKWRTTKWGQNGSSEVVLTPHSGYSYESILESMWDKTRENLERLGNGEELEWKL